MALAQKMARATRRKRTAGGQVRISPKRTAAAQEQSSRAPKNDKEGILAELATLIHEARESETRSLDVRVSKLERRQKGRKVKNALANAER